MHRKIMGSDSLGSRVKKLRIQKNLTQIELGKLSGIHYTNIGRIENKGAIPQADVLYLIAKGLDTSTAWLLTGCTDVEEAETLPEDTREVHEDNQEGNLLQVQIIQLLPLLTEDEKNDLISYINYIIYRRTISNE